MKTKDGSPAWARTTITLSNAKSVSYRDFNGLKCRIGPDEPTLTRTPRLLLLIRSGGTGCQSQPRSFLLNRSEWRARAVGSTRFSQASASFQSRFTQDTEISRARGFFRASSSNDQGVTTTVTF